MTDKVKNIISRYEKKQENILSVLEDLNAEFNYLYEDVLRNVSSEFNLPLSKVFSLATFYKAFSLKPKGKHIVLVCMGTACHVRGGPKISEQLEQILNIKSGETTPDNLFTLETVNCLGACALGPLMVIDGKYHGKVTSGKISKILKEYKK